MFAEDLVLAGRIGAIFLIDNGIGNHLTNGNRDFEGARRVVNPNEDATIVTGAANRSRQFFTAIANCK